MEALPIYWFLDIYEITNRAYGNSLHSVGCFPTRYLRSRDRNHTHIHNRVIIYTELAKCMRQLINYFTHARVTDNYVLLIGHSSRFIRCVAFCGLIDFVDVRSRVSRYTTLLSFEHGVFFKINKDTNAPVPRELNRVVTSPRYGDSLESSYFVTKALSAYLNSYISECSHKANNLSKDHTLVKIIPKLWDAYSVNYQLARPGQ